jgi:adenylate kinase
MERIQKPHNYGLTAEEEELAKYKNLNEKEKREREEREERERDEQEATTDRMKKQKEWNIKSDQIKRQEVAILDTQTAPLRNYLMTHVMPTLTKALIGIFNI